MAARDGSTTSDLGAWIADLRSRVDHGELERLGPVDLGYGTGHLAGETTIRVMLADLDHIDGLPAHARERVDLPHRRAELLDDFRQLRAMIG